MLTTYVSRFVLTFLDCSNETLLVVVSKLSIIIDVFCDNETTTFVLVEYIITRVCSYIRT